MTEKPGTAELRRHNDTGVVTVVRADPVIRVSVELLAQAGAPWWDGNTLVLDAATLYRYRFVRAEESARSWIFERITGS